MNLELYNIIRNIEKELKAESDMPEFKVYLSTGEDEDIDLVIMNKFVEAKPDLPEYILETFINKLKKSDFNYEHCFMYPSPLQVSSLQENGSIINETTENHYKLKRIKNL